MTKEISHVAPISPQSPMTDSGRKSFLKKEELRLKIQNLGAFMVFLKTFIDLRPNPIECFVYSRHSVNNYGINQNERPESGPHV